MDEGAPEVAADLLRTVLVIDIELGITTVATLVLGVFPGLVLRFGDLRDLTGAFGV